MDNSRLSLGSYQASRLAIKAAYQSVYASREKEDSWHARSTHIIQAFIREEIQALARQAEMRIVNAGSGDLSYGVDAGFQLDFALGSLLKTRRAIVSDIEHLCISSGSLDLVICVGSVLNYVSPLAAIAEFVRVIKPGGHLILEYERSAALSYLFTEAFRRSSCKVEARYKGIRHPMWVYADSFIGALLEKGGFSERRRLYFHAIPPLFCRITGLDVAAKIADRFDESICRTTLLRKVAANCLVCCVKN